MTLCSFTHRFFRRPTIASMLLLLLLLQPPANVTARTTAAVVDANNRQQKAGANNTVTVTTIRVTTVPPPPRTTTTDATNVVVVGRYVSNLDGQCMRCLCHASTVCNATFGCSRGYCGPYYLHREYWQDAGRLVLQDDDADRDRAFVDCAEDTSCAQKIVVNYMAKWGRDCNKDGVTDCDDYARTHFNGREDCSSIEKTNFWRRYETCRPANNRGLFDI